MSYRPRHYPWTSPRSVTTFPCCDVPSATTGRWSISTAAQRRRSRYLYWTPNGISCFTAMRRCTAAPTPWVGSA